MNLKENHYGSENGTRVTNAPAKEWWRKTTNHHGILHVHLKLFYFGFQLQLLHFLFREMVSWLITYRNLVITCVPQMLMVAQRTTKGKQSMNELRQTAKKSHQEVGHSVVEIRGQFGRNHHSRPQRKVCFLR